jgi:hypothetical protein
LPAFAARSEIFNFLATCNAPLGRLLLKGLFFDTLQISDAFLPGIYFHNAISSAK